MKIPKSICFLLLSQCFRLIESMATKNTCLYYLTDYLDKNLPPDFPLLKRIEVFFSSSILSFSLPKNWPEMRSHAFALASSPTMSKPSLNQTINKTIS